MKRSKSQYSILSVVHAFRLLEAFRDAEDLGVTELSRQLGLHKNKTFRLLATLEELGYVEQGEGSDRYRVTSRCIEFGQVVARRRSLLRCARPVLEQLARAFGETAHLAQLDEFEVVHLDGESADRGVAALLRVGRRLPAHCTALGKVLLAGGEQAERYDRELAASSDLVPRTSATISDRDKFFEHLRSVASQGFAIDHEECEAGLVCAAAPVQDATGRVVAALSVSGPAFRLPSEQLMRAAVPAVRASAEHLSREIGYAP